MIDKAVSYLFSGSPRFAGVVIHSHAAAGVAWSGRTSEKRTIFR